jgi:hypothetical protein
MNSKVSMMKSMVVAVALAAGVSGMAHAGDGSMGRFGDSYAYFNSQVINKAPSEWRQSNPQGLSERVLESYSAPGEAWHLNTPVFDNARSSWRLAHPNGLSEREFQALSSEAPAWQSSTPSATSALASTTEAPVVTSAVK